MKRHLNHFVKKELFKDEGLPFSNNRRYFPKSKDIRNHIYIAIMAKRLSKIDQENVHLKIEEWQNESPKEEFLFVHQTGWQRRLLRYGNELCLLDATYKTTRYAIPLFFLAVKTNVDYQVVGSFCLLDESTDSIKRGIEVLQKWTGPDWHPKYFIVDNSSAEIGAITECFPDTNIYICDFLREQAWERWTAKASNQVSDCQKEVLACMRRIAHSCNETYFKIWVHELQNKDFWKRNEKLRSWFSKNWLSVPERWVWGFQKDRFLVHVRTNNGLERQNKLFKYKYLKQYSDHSLSQMLTTLVKEFLPEKLEHYIDENTIASAEYRKYNDQMPLFLHDRPKFFINHCKNRMSSALSLDSSNIHSCEEDGTFYVKSDDGKTLYELDHGKQNRPPSCTCPDFNMMFLPCKHFFLIWHNSSKWSWDSFPDWYCHSPFLNIDKDVIFLSKEECSQFSLNDADSVDCNGSGDETPSVVHHSQIPVPTYPKRSTITTCVEYLGLIKNVLYNVVDQVALKACETKLISLYHHLQGCCQIDSGLTVRTTAPKKAQVQKRNAKGVTLKKLPLPYKRKHPFSGRVGNKAHVMRNRYMVNVPLTTNLKRPFSSIDSDLSTSKRVCTETGSISSTVLSHTTTFSKDEHSSVNNLETVIFRIGPHNVTPLQLQSLDPELPMERLLYLKGIDPTFKEGWLYDEILNAFFFCLCKYNHHLLYISSCTMQTIEIGSGIDMLFAGEDIHNKKLVLAPCNSSGGHWVLIGLDILNKVVFYIDPMHNTVGMQHTINAQIACQMIARVALEKLGVTGVTLSSPTHCLQSGGSSCGVYVCWYAQQLVSEQSIELPLDQRNFRKEILQILQKYNEC